MAAVKRCRGRPLKEINKADFEDACEMQCTQKEICYAFGVSEKTLNAWCKRTYGKGFRETFEEKRQPGFKSLRSAQYALALSGNTTMLIWLGRNWLGQTDKQIVEKEEEPLQENPEEREEFNAKYNNIKDELMKYLEKRNVNSAMFQNKIEDFMDLWTIKEQLKQDIKVRGLYTKYNNGGGQSGEKDNPSVEKLLKVTAKLKEILQDLEVDFETLCGEDDKL